MPETLVLGLGNPLMSDEGFGVTAVRRLRSDYDLPEDIEVVDGGTLGLTLLPLLEDAQQVIILDAVDVSEPPGSRVVIGWDDVRRRLPLKISPHQETLTEMLALLELRDKRPGRFQIVGVQPATLEMGLELSPQVEASLPSALAEVADILRSWGHNLQMRHRAATG